MLEELNCSYEGEYLAQDSISQKKPSGIYCLQGNFIKFCTPAEHVAYLGCPNCYKKVTDNRLTGFYCNNCGKIVK